jgi:predicted RNA-binding Zn ribbon-like protein
MDADWLRFRYEGGAWEEALDWSHEDPRTSALQRQLSEVDRWLKGQAHKLATAQEALAVQELIEAMLVGQPKIQESK